MSGAREARTWPWPALAALLSLAANPAAAWPDGAYFFRDFSVTFQPLRHFFLRSLRDGRWAFWNPYSYEGSALLPILYPFDLLQALWPGPVAASFLLTLHFPIAALAMYALARELGASRPGACAAGVAFSLGGFAQSTLNLCIFLEALALAPLVAVTLLRAALRGGRWIPVAALALGVSISTLAVEFVGQALVLGVVLVWVAGLTRGRLLRVGAAAGLGVALAGLPILLTAGIVSESLRSAGPIGSLQRSLHPVSMLQFLTPNLFVSLAEPVRYGWPTRLFPESVPYFLSMYLGPLVLATASLGWRAAPARLRVGLSALALLGLWYALGRHAGLASVLSPLVPFLRFPVKAFLTPYLCVSLLVGLGATRLERGRGWNAWAILTGALTALVVALASLAHAFGPAVAAWLRVRPETLPRHLTLLGRDAALGVSLCLVAWLLAWGVGRRGWPAARAGWALVGLLACDLARGAWGMNPQTSPLFYRPLPEMPPLVAGLDGGRVLSLGYGGSPRMTQFMASARPETELASFFLYRQLLNPFSNLLDDVDLAGGRDLHSFIPNSPLLQPGDYRPEAIGGVSRILRNAAVVRVVSLDPIGHPELRLRAQVATGLPGLELHVYDLMDPWPHAFLACRAEAEADRRVAQEKALAPEFDLQRAVILDAQAPAACATGSVVRRIVAPGEEAYDVAADGPGILVMRDSYTPSWGATVDGAPVRVQRANGRHRAVAVAPGRHQVRVFYDPPLLRPGIAISALALVVVAALLLRPRAGARAR